VRPGFTQADAAELREMAAGHVPIAVTCRGLGFFKQTFFNWRNSPVSQWDWDNAHCANSAFDIHLGDTTFGYRTISDEIEVDSDNIAS
jgi:putative transposase